MSLSRTSSLLACTAFIFAACEKASTPEEAEQQQQKAQQAAKQAQAAATPKPGSWMYDKTQRTTTLEKRAY